MGMQPMALQKALLDKTALWKFKNSRDQDIGDWIFTMERHFRRMQEIYANISDRHKVDCAVDYLRDSALSVYKDLENGNIDVTWEMLKKALKETFQPFDFIKKIINLIIVKISLIIEINSITIVGDRIIII